MPDTEPSLAADQFRPSDYSAAIVQCIIENCVPVAGARVLDVGCGSGVLLAAAGALHARSLSGVDIEIGAIAAANALLDEQGFAGISDIQQGELFTPLAARQFDLVLANLPHFPMDRAAVDGRLASWSAGGADGRKLLDRFLDGLVPHLAPEGCALIMHNAFIGLEKTQKKASELGLSVEVVNSFLVPLPQGKINVMTQAVLARETGKTIHRFGSYAFGTVTVLRLSHAHSKEGAE